MMLDVYPPITENQYNRCNFAKLDYAKMDSKEVMARYGLKYRSDLTSAVKRGINKLYNVVLRVERKQTQDNTTTTL
ncbi:MAG: hypothetical protein QXY34_02430 [Candidatus Bathyarchaeia archaeon]